MPIKNLLPAAALFLVCAALARAGSGGVFPYAYTETALDNGLKVVIVPMKGSGTVAYYSVVRTGSRDEVEPGHSGFAHFFEHMMFRGTKKYPGEVYDRLVTEMGADANAFTSNDLTCYYMNVAAPDLEKVMDLESDRFRNLSYPEDQFKTEAGAIWGEYLKGLSSPWRILDEAVRRAAYERHTYRHTTMGFREDIRAMPGMYEYSLSFFNRFYRPDNVVLLIAGDVDAGAALALVRRYYGGWARGYEPPAVPAEPGQMSGRRASVSFGGKTLPILTLAYKAPAFDAASVESAALELAGDLLFGETSDLYRRLVLEERRLESLQADFSPARDPGLAEVTAMVREPADIPAVERELKGAIASFVSAGPDSSRLEDLKKRRRYGFLMGLDTPPRVAGRLVRFLALAGTMEAVNARYAAFEKVAPADVRLASARTLAPSRETAVILKGN
jgi:zinc protease